MNIFILTIAFLTLSGEIEIQTARLEKCPDEKAMKVYLDSIVRKGGKFSKYTAECSMYEIAPLEGDPDGKSEEF